MITLQASEDFSGLTSCENVCFSFFVCVCQFKSFKLVAAKLYLSLFLQTGFKVKKKVVLMSVAYMITTLVSFIHALEKVCNISLLKVIQA